MARTLLVALALVGCGNDPQCDRLARAYAAAVSQAQRCDPRAENPCSGIVRRSLSDGSNFCDRVGIDPAQEQAIEELLGQFAAQRCALGPALPCPSPPEFECRDDGQDGGTCVRKSS